MEITAFGDLYRGRRVLLTGHTGFKGSWMALWLQQLGAHVCGLALDPDTSPSHWELLGLDIEESRIDLRDLAAVHQSVGAFRPEIVFHMAAQALVRRSYRDPLDTWSTNVMGTANLLESCRGLPELQAVVVVTTDKCYHNREWLWGYREEDRLGGHDPYSASKACTEILVQSYRDSFFRPHHGPLIATARAGNVIGGGDWSEDRLLPDLLRAVSQGKALVIRSPKATRPWQHVLEPLSGYLRLGQKLLEKDASCAESWNFGPSSEGNCTVEDVLHKLRSSWDALRWEVTQEAQPHEASLLHLDSTKARHRLAWRPVWTLDEGLAYTALWNQSYLTQGKVLSLEQLNAYQSAAARARVAWCSTSPAKGEI
ncbi:CDP-glucose 4,6-dehydratase [Myxococcota bacterium]|nr:CDP-glucose 4,6-dehydratase [Myxococcota bacterium]